MYLSANSSVSIRVLLSACSYQLFPPPPPAPSMYTGPQMSTLTYPCDSNPCANGLNCTVNHNCHHNDQTCTPYTCVPTCSLSSRSHLALKGVASAHVALPVEEKDCFGYVARGGVEGVGCGYEDSVKAAYCEEKLLHCHHNGNEYSELQLLPKDNTILFYIFSPQLMEHSFTLIHTTSVSAIMDA